jgi:PAP2 superfamily
VTQESRMQLPPYGKMSEEYGKLLQDPPMPDWRRDEPEPERTARFEKWRVEMRDRLAKHVCPYYDQSSGWKGDAAARAVDATKAEITVMIDHLQGKASYLGKKPVSDNLQADSFVHDHLYHFRLEDDLKAPLAVNYEEYDCKLTPGQLNHARSVMDDAYSKKTGGLFYFKGEFLRPRPYQTSMIFGRHEFTSRTARTALHSAFPSGHCVEGMLFTCALADSWFTDNAVPSLGSLASLRQFAVDFGDRRVFAGVHYPADNIASWIIALNLIPDLYRNREKILEFAFRAIVEHSTVYKVVQEHYPKHDTLRPAFNLLQQELATVEKSLSASAARKCGAAG